MKEPCNIVLGRVWWKCFYEKPHTNVRNRRTHLVWVTEWPIRDIRFKCVLLVLRLERGNRQGCKEYHTLADTKSQLYPPGHAHLDLWETKTETTECKESLQVRRWITEWSCTGHGLKRSNSIGILEFPSIVLFSDNSNSGWNFLFGWTVICFLKKYFAPFS